MLKLNIAPEKIAKARGYAKQITGSFDWLFNGYSSVSIERTILRLMGMDGAIEGGEPIPNIVVDHLKSKNILNRGVAYWVVNAMLASNMSVQEVGDAVAQGDLDLSQVKKADDSKVLAKLDEVVTNSLRNIKKQSQ